MRDVRGSPGSAALSLAGAMLVAGCGQPAPQGQIIAAVNGEDITSRDLDRLEARLPTGEHPDARLRGQLVGALVDARLAAAEARQEGIGKTPEYLDASRAANDAILIDLLNRRIIAGLQPPSPGDVDRYIETHPNRFSGREIVRLDQLRFTRTNAAMAAVARVTTLEQAEAALKAIGMPSQRGVVTLDTLALPDDAAERLRTLPATSLLGDEQGGMVSLSQVLARTPQPVAENEARATASALIARDAAREAIAALHARLRKGAKISYQKGYAPPGAAGK